MKLIVLSVRDRAADCFGQPMFVVSLGGAIRSFGDEINRKDVNNQLSKHPEDFDLYQIGEFDDNSAELIPCKPRQVAVGKDLVRAE